MGISIFSRKFSEGSGRTESFAPLGPTTLRDVRRDKERRRPSVTTAPNPNPYRFKVLKERHVGNYALVLIRYPDCTTHNGEKIAVYEDIDRWNELRDSGFVDPHFLDGTYSPIARFPADVVGWLRAERFVEMLDDEDREEEEP